MVVLVTRPAMTTVQVASSPVTGATRNGQSTSANLFPTRLLADQAQPTATSAFLPSGPAPILVPSTARGIERGPVTSYHGASFISEPIDPPASAPAFHPDLQRLLAEIPVSTFVLTLTDPRLRFLGSGRRRYDDLVARLPTFGGGDLVGVGGLQRLDQT